MSLWQRLRGAFGRPEPEEGDEEVRAPGPPPPPREPARVDVAARLEAALAREPGARSAAVRELLASLRGTSEEGAIVAAASRERDRLDDDARVVLARLLHDRGDVGAARDLLVGARAADALVLAAELDAERGDLAAALASIERVLARGLDTPGARERWVRWSRALGGDAPSRGLDDAVTALAPAPAGVPYRILREVARGGAGTVYEAEEERLGRLVAFKVYHAGRRDRAALQREAEVAVQLAGPGVVRVLDASPEQGWVALEWAEGGSLREVLRRAAGAELDRWVRDLAGALGRVHRAGWVHGDVKPGNVLLGADGGARLTDFGIARRVGEETSGGSPGYVSPERLALAPASPSDDVYGLGRVVEDLLEAGAGGPAYGPALVAACLRPAGARPADGAAVLAWLDARGVRTPPEPDGA